MHYDGHEDGHTAGEYHVGRDGHSVVLLSSQAEFGAITEANLRPWGLERYGLHAGL